jgi:hypothetical protein
VFTTNFRLIFAGGKPIILSMRARFPWCQLLETIAVFIIAAVHLQAQQWTQTSASLDKWKAVAVSADGRHILAATKLSPGGFLVMSEDYGASWTTSSVPSTTWNSVAMSADGKMRFAAGTVASGGKGVIYNSSDSGASWTSNSAPFSSPTSIAASRNGQKVYAAFFNSTSLPVSTNGMQTWQTANLPVAAWGALGLSADDSTVAVGANAGPVYISHDAGTTWSNTGLPTAPWSWLASSPDGTCWIASAFVTTVGGFVFTSTDSGASWRSNTLPIKNWTGAAISADAKTMLVSSSLSPVSPAYVSTDGGSTWLPTTTPVASQTNWFAAALAADGGRMFGLVFNGNIYTRTISVPPALSARSLESGELRLSWLQPSTSFMLQQNLGLGNTGWVAMTNDPSFSPTNLHVEVVLSGPLPNAFYRLATP